MTRPNKTKAIKRLRKALHAIPELKELSYDSPEFKKWKRDMQVTFRNTFEDTSSQRKEFENIHFSPMPAALLGMDRMTSSTVFQNAYMEALESVTSLLESMIEEIEDFWEDDNQTLIPSGDQANGRPSSNKVFVIHGRDEGTKETVARFLETLSLEPVILHEQPNQGRTIIEKFEYHAQVGFAVVLLTPDDAGGLLGNKDAVKPRARQNVIFEFGYFIGKLGRKRVCALVKGDVEKPSDYDGVLYIPLDDSDGWKMRLIRELKTAGFEVDANKAISP